MKRTRVVRVVTIVFAASAILSNEWRTAAAEAPSPARPDTLWYHASDVALLGTTGRPQLVEFFHPG